MTSSVRRVGSVSSDPNERAFLPFAVESHLLEGLTEPFLCFAGDAKKSRRIIQHVPCPWQHGDLRGRRQCVAHSDNRTQVGRVPFSGNQQHVGTQALESRKD